MNKIIEGPKLKDCSKQEKDEQNNLNRLLTRFKQ